MMEVENRIEETFSGQVDELPDDLKERRVNGNHPAINGHGNGNGVILEESEEEDLGDVGMEKAPADASQAIAGRVIKKVCVESRVLVVFYSRNMLEHLSNWILSRPRDQPRRAPSPSLELQWVFLE